MKLSLSNVLELAGASKGNFDARRARGLMSFFPLDHGAAADLDPLKPGTSVHNPTPAISDNDGRSRRRYTIADAVAIDLFERANAHSRIDNHVLDRAIDNSSNFIRLAVEGGPGAPRQHYGDPDLYVGVALYEPEGRWHFDAGTLAEIEAQIPKFHDRDGLRDPISEIILLNLSEAHRRVMRRIGNAGRGGDLIKLLGPAE